jgi:SAM-dependent methyltransferase
MTERPRPHRDQAGWDQRYVEGDLPWDSGKPDPHLGRVIEKFGIAPSRGLEIGCGTGTNTIWLAGEGFEMTGVDLAPTAIEKAEAKAAEAGVSCDLMVRDFLSEEVPGGPFAFIYDRGCFHVFDTDGERARFAEHVAKLLGPAGVWHSFVGSTDGPPRDTGPPRRSATEIATAVEPYLEILELRTTTFDRVDDGRIRAWVLVARRRD